MNINDIKPGQELWFKDRDKEKGWVTGHGTVQSTEKGNVTLQNEDGLHTVSSYSCYKDEKTMEWDLKWDRQFDSFEEKLMQVGGKYIDMCQKALNTEIGVLKAQLPVNQDLFIQDTKMKLQLFGSQFKEKVMDIADSFVNGTQKTALSRMNEETKNLVFHTDLSKYEPGTLSLNDSDLAGIPFDDEVELNDSDLNFTQESGLRL